MAEDVQTGGLIKFRYGKGDSSPRLDEKRKRGIQDAYAQFHERKREIQGAYAQFDERKALERRNRMIFWVLAAIVTLVVLILIGIFVL